MRVLIVDDEKLARDRLRELLNEIGGHTVVGEGMNGNEAVEKSAALNPDVVLTDIRMPGMDGLEAAMHLMGMENPPMVIFTTAYDQHALHAFEVNAVDYLLKPVEAERLATAVERARKRQIAEAKSQEPKAELDFERLVQMLGDRKGRREQLAIKVDDRFLLIQTDEVVHASVEDDQIRVVTNSLSGTSNYRTLDELQARLDPAVFWRVHRSHLVNINKIKEIVPWFSRNYILKMRDGKGTEIPVSRSQTKRLREYLRL